MSRWLITLAILIVVALLLFVVIVRKDVVTILRERSARKERDRVRNEAFTRSKELLQFLLADPEVARLVRDGLTRELPPSDGVMVETLAIAPDGAANVVRVPSGLGHYKRS